jgi:hypothetical protein
MGKKRRKFRFQGYVVVPLRYSSVHTSLVTIDSQDSPLHLLNLIRLSTTPLKDVFTGKKYHGTAQRCQTTMRMHFNALRQPLHDFHISVSFLVFAWLEDVCV